MAGETTTTWLEQAKNWVSEMAARFDLTGPNIVHALVYACAGFFIGFFLSRYFKSFLVGVILCIVVLGGLHYFHVITIDMEQLKAIFGVSADQSLEAYVTMLADWVKTHLLFAISSLIGFILGFKAG
jgi:uncharacterized membrane protein (Fun14 family)